MMALPRSSGSWAQTSGQWSPPLTDESLLMAAVAVQPLVATLIVGAEFLSWSRATAEANFLSWNRGVFKPFHDFLGARQQSLRDARLVRPRLPDGSGGGSERQQQQQQLRPRVPPPSRRAQPLAARPPPPLPPLTVNFQHVFQEQPPLGEDRQCNGASCIPPGV